MTQSQPLKICTEKEMRGRRNEIALDEARNELVKLQKGDEEKLFSMAKNSRPCLNHLREYMICWM